MRKHRSFHPTALSSLETRVVLSHIGLGHAALVHPIHHFAAPVSVNHLSLNGTVSGTFVTTITPLSNLAGGTTTTFQGTGSISGLGQVTVTGSLTTSVSATGVRSTVESFTLTTSQGSVTIQLTKPASTPTSPPTDQSSFSIVNATGVFKGATGTGTASLKTITEAVPTVPPTVARGTFTLTLNSNPTVL
jgi:hypothetical protein